jgi:hypothetical protein
VARLKQMLSFVDASSATAHTSVGKQSFTGRRCRGERFRSRDDAALPRL